MAEPLSVLIIEDTPARRDKLTRLFAGHTCDAVNTGTEAIERLETRTFDVVCLDHDLADELTGVDVAHAIQTGASRPKLILVHSMNPTGVASICAVLPDAVICSIDQLERSRAIYGNVRSLAASGDVEGLRNLLR